MRWGLQSSIKSKIFNLAKPTAEAFQNFAEWLVQGKVLPRSFDVTSLVDAHYYELAAMIPRRAMRNSAPLSFAQQRLWFLNQLEPESAAYNEAMALRFEGELNVDALNRALNTIVERHEVLRTNIRTDESGDPVQLIGECRAVGLPLLDLQESSQSDVRRAIAEIRNRPFNLGQDLMLRATLLKTGTNEHILVVVKHHIASDGWSTSMRTRHDDFQSPCRVSI